MRFFIAVALMLSLLFGTPVMAADNYDFVDTTSHWAAENIAQCSAYQLMNGYPGRVFMPEQNLSKAEALLVIGKSLGWDRNSEGFSSDSLNYPKDVWPGFKDYIALAVKKNLINEDDVLSTSFNAPATRLEMAVWIAKAMNLNGNANALTFNDLYAVPQESRKLLAGVVEEGIFVGLPGNVFAPDKQLTRAEMTTILVRLVDEGSITPPEGKPVTGKVSKIDLSQNIITIEQLNGEERSFTLRDNFSIYGQGKKTLSSDLAAGDSVKLILDSNNNCVLVINSSAKTPVLSLAGSGEKGYVVNKYLDYFTVRIKYTEILEVPSDVLITEGGAKSSYSTLAKGDNVELLGFGDTITSVNILDNDKKIFGTVQNVNDYKITINEDDDNTASFDVINNPRITDSDGNRIFLDEIKSGDYIEITLDNYSKVREVKVGIDTYNDLEGYITSLRTSGVKRIVIKDIDGDSHGYDIANNVQVIEGNIKGDLSDLVTDMWVELVLDNNDEVKKIVILGNEAVEGRVSDIWTDTRRIRIEKSNGDEKTYYLSGQLSVSQGGATRSLNSISEGDWVRLFLNRNTQVSDIWVINELSIEGTVDYLTTAGSDKIRIKRQNGNLETYYLHSNVQVKDSSTSKSINYIEKNMKVRLALNKSEVVTRIDVLDNADTDVSDMEGKIMHIQTAGSERVMEIITDKGDNKTYYFAKTVIVFEDGEPRSLNYLLRGMNVQLTINSSGEVSRIDVETITDSTSISGKVVLIDKIGSQWKMDLLADDNRRYSYYLDGGVDVRESGDYSDVSDIYEDMYVQVTIDDEGNVTRIDIFGSTKLEGVVTYIRSARDRMDIRGTDGQGETYFFSDNVSVFENGNPGRIRDVYEGMKVHLTLDWTGDVTRIEIVGWEYVEGEVTYIRTTGTPRIEIENNNSGDIEMYDLSESAEVWRNGIQEALEDIDRGDDVVLSLDDRGKVIRIDL